MHVYDIARVEALAGPQGTLYGASSLSGTLRIITNKPDPTAFSASYDVKADKYGKGNGGGEFEGYVNVPLTDHMAVRLVGYYEHDGGYINNVVGENTYQRGVPGTDRGCLHRTQRPADRQQPRRLGATLQSRRYLWRTRRAEDRSQRQLVDFAGSPMAEPKGGRELYVRSQQGDLNVTDFIDGINEDKWYQSALTVEGKVANFDIVYSGGWFERNVHNLVDYANYTVGYDALSQQPGATYTATRYLDCKSGTPATNCNGAGGTVTDPTQFVDNHDKYTKLNQEIRVTSPADWRLRGVAGRFISGRRTISRAAIRGSRSAAVLFRRRPDRYHLLDAANSRR